MTTVTVKDYGNILYNSLLIAGGVVASRYTMKALGMKDRPIELKLKSVGMLAADISISNYGIKALQNNNIVPKTIFT